MDEFKNIAGVVVLYNPDNSVSENILSYINQVDRLFAVDNSGNANPAVIDRIKKFTNLVYIRNGENLGVAQALNLGAQKALENGYDYILTMDQDSKAAPDMVTNMLSCLEVYDPSQVGIITPLHIICNVPPQTEGKCSDVFLTMTSGNLLNLGIYNKVLPFAEELFIDCIDYDCCLKMHQHGYKIIQASSAVLLHKLGNIKTYYLPGRKKFHVTNHPPFRRYYITRNRFYLMNKYRKEFPDFFRDQLIVFFREFLWIILFEKEKLSKIKMVYKGYVDFKKGILGKGVDF